MMRTGFLKVAALACLSATPALAEIDGHGPDAWRVTGVAADDVLNMRMGPGTQYLVIDALAPNARGLEQITCVPLLIPQIYHKLTEAQRSKLPQRWCLMRSADFAKAGWVAQRFITEDNGQGVVRPPASTHAGPDVRSDGGDPLIDGAADLVRDLYAAVASYQGGANFPFSASDGARYFSTDILPFLDGHGGDVLYDAQDFDGQILRIAPDPEQPMFRGMITINVDFTNFGAAKRAVFRLRADPAQPGAPFRIFRVEHDDWSFPE